MTHPRSVRSATIHFGLVAIGVRLYTSVESQDDISFNMLRDVDHARLKQQYVAATDGQVVEKDNVVKGYEYEPDKFVVFSKDELEALDSIDNGQIVIREFIRSSMLDPVYMAEEKCFYLGPDKGSDLAYAVVLDALDETKRMAIATYARNGKERLIAIRARGPLLLLHELRYASEVRGAEGVPLPTVNPKPAELRLAKQIIERMSRDVFVIESYTDTVNERRRAMIKKKILDGETVVADSPKAAANVVDMLEALKASIDTIPDRSVKKIAPARDRKARIKSVAKKRKAS